MTLTVAKWIAKKLQSDFNIVKVKFFVCFLRVYVQGHFSVNSGGQQLVSEPFVASSLILQ